jgi:putative transposase
VDLTREKNIKGRKRHLIVDTNGFVIRVLVSAADISDNERVDQGYKEQFVEWVSQEHNWTIEVVTKPSDQVGFAVQPKRWVVERTFAWLGRSRQLSKEYDRLPESTESWVYLASINILLKRLASAS